MSQPNGVVAAVLAFLLFGLFLCSCLTYNEDWDDFHWVERKDTCDGGSKLTSRFYNDQVCLEAGGVEDCTKYDDIDNPESEGADEASDIFRATSVLVGINIAFLLILFGLAVSVVFASLRNEVVNSCAQKLLNPVFLGVVSACLCVSSILISIMVSAQTAVRGDFIPTCGKPDEVRVAFGVGLHIFIAVVSFAVAALLCNPQTRGQCVTAFASSAPPRQANANHGFAPQQPSRGIPSQNDKFVVEQTATDPLARKNDAPSWLM